MQQMFPNTIIFFPTFIVAKTQIMRKIFFIAFLGAMTAMISCQNAARSQGTVKQTIPVEEFEKKLSDTDIQLIDVRTPEEYSGGHLKNAVNIDYRSGDFESRLRALDKNKTVLVYCLSGGRSGNAANKMQEIGFARIYNMDGGIMKWTAAGKPVEKNAGQPAANGMTMDEFDKMTAKNTYVLVDYNARWCEPCKKMMPMLESIAGKYKDSLYLLKIDADANKALMTQKGLSSIPYLELYKNGRLAWKHDGLIEEEQLVKETGIGKR